MEIDEQERIRYYLRALKKHTSTNVLHEVKTCVRQQSRDEFLSLEDIQYDLLQEAEFGGDVQSSRDPHVGDKVHARHPAKSGLRTTRPRRAQASAAAVKPSTRSNVVCWGCGRVGHTLMQCYTTSEEDKRKIMEDRRRIRKPGGDDTATAAKATKQEILKRFYSKKPKSKGDESKGKTSKTVSFADKSRASAASSEKKGSSQAQSYAGAAMANPIRATCSMAVAGSKRKVNPPREQDIEDPHGDPYPVLAPGVVCLNNDSREVVYEEEVLLDSGASHNMVNAVRHLHLIELAFAVVSLADGSIQNCQFRGLMRILATDIETGEQVTFPMPDTSLVPGLRTVLWSVAALSAQGHEVIFGDTAVTIALHAGTERQLMIRL